MEPIQIMLIDDHKIILDGISALLSEDEITDVKVAFQNPLEGLAYLEKNHIDVILTDLDMPEMNGEDVVAFCKAKFSNIKVIVLSMHNEKSVIKHLIQIGADGYLVKSAGKAEIINAIKTVHQGVKFFGEEVMQSLITEEENKQPVEDPILKQLTEREKEIIIHIANGLSSKEIGAKLFISPRTAETHRNNILKKLDLTGIAGIVRFAFQNQLIK